MFIFVVLFINISPVIEFFRIIFPVMFIIFVLDHFKENDVLCLGIAFFLLILIIALQNLV